MSEKRTPLLPTKPRKDFFDRAAFSLAALLPRLVGTNSGLLSTDFNLLPNRFPITIWFGHFH